MMTRFWVILGDAGTFEQVMLPHHPCEASAEGAAPAYDVDRSAVVEMERAGDPAIEDPQPDGSWSLNLGRYKARLQAAIDADRARLVGDNSRKLYAHVRKGVEAGELLALAPATRAGFSAGDLDTRFPWLSAEAAARGEAIDATAARVRDAMLASEATSRRNEARAVAAKEALRAAATRAAADAAVAIDWDEE